MLLNLVVNAAQAMAEAGIERGRITINTLTAPDGSAVIRVCDEGPGMPEAVRARAFEPFFTTRADRAGTGLGLAICHALVTAMGGRIEIESAPGEGTEVRLCFPPCGAGA